MDRREFLGRLAGSAAALSLPGHLFAGKTSEGAATAFIYDPLYLDHWLFEGHPESPERLQRVMRAMTETKLLDRLRRIAPLGDIEQELYRVHTRDHVEQLKARHPQSHKVAVAVVGGALAAVDAVCIGKAGNAFCAARPPGHHATNTGRVEGFCFYNAVAIAARYAREQYQHRKILIVDWDYHHGNGTEAVFYADPDVLFFSTHDYRAYPGTGDPARHGEGAGEGFNINVHLDCGATDATIVRAFEQHLLPAARSFKPDLILISAGFDSRVGDQLGCFAVTDDGFVTLTRMVMTLADEFCDGRIVSVLEGGYTPAGLASSVVAHVRALNDAATG